MLRPIAQSLLLPLLVGQLLLVPSAVCAGDPPPLQLAGTLPFSAEQLTQALSLRPPPEGWSAQIVRVAGAETGPLVVSVGPHRLSLDLGGAEGMAAARLVALALVALLGEGAPGSEPTASPSATSPSVASATAPSVASATAPSIAHRAPTAAPTPSSAASTAPPVQGTNADHAPAVASAGREVRLAVEAMGSVGRGLGRLELWGAGLGAGLLGDSRSLLFGGAVEGVVVPGATREGLRRTMVALRLRAHAGVRLGLLQVLLGPMLAPFWVLGGERDFSAWLVAVGPSVRATVPVSPAAQVLLFAGVDYYLRRFELTAHGRRVLATPRVAMTFGVGVAWRLI